MQLGKGKEEGAVLDSLAESKVASSSISNQPQRDVRKLLILDSDQTIPKSHVNNIISAMMAKARWEYAVNTSQLDAAGRTILMDKYRKIATSVLNQQPQQKEPDIHPNEHKEIGFTIQTFKFTEADVSKNPTPDQLEQAMFKKIINTLMPQLFPTSLPALCKSEIERLDKAGYAIAIASFADKRIKEQFIPRFLREKIGLSNELINKIYIEPFANPKEGNKNPAIQRCCAPGTEKPYRLLPGAEIFLIDDSSRR